MTSLLHNLPFLLVAIGGVMMGVMALLLAGAALFMMLLEEPVPYRGSR